MKLNSHHAIAGMRYCSHTIIGGVSHNKNHRYYIPEDPSERKSVLDAVVTCFGESKPRVVSTHRGLLDKVSEKVSDFLSEVFNCLICDLLTELLSLKIALKGPTSLETLIIQSSRATFLRF